MFLKKIQNSILICDLKSNEIYKLLLLFKIFVPIIDNAIKTNPLKLRRYLSYLA